MDRHRMTAFPGERGEVQIGRKKDIATADQSIQLGLRPKIQGQIKQLVRIAEAAPRHVGMVELRQFYGLGRIIKQKIFILPIQFE